MPELKFDIKTAADLTAVKETAKSFDQARDASGRFSKSTESAGEQTGQAGEHAEMSARSFRRLAHAMGSEVPGAAALMEAGFEAGTEPMLASTFLLLAGIEMLKSAIEKINREKEQAQKLSDALADADTRENTVLEKQREALERAEVAEAVFHHNYVRNAQNAIDQAEQLAEAVLKTAAGADDSELSRRNQIAGREVEDMEHRGVISHATALKLKEQIDIAYEQQKMIRQLAMDKLEEAAIARQLANKQIALRNGEAAEKDAAARYESASAAQAANEAKREDAKNKIAAAESVVKGLRETGVTDENIQKLKESYEQTSGKPSDGPGAASLSEMFTYLSRHAGGIVPRQLFGTSGDVNLATYQGAQLDIQAGKLDLERARQNALGLDTAKGTAESDLSFARQQMNQNRQATQTLAEKLTETKSTNAIKEGGALMDLGMSKSGAALQSDRTSAESVLSGGQLTGADAQKLIADASAIAGHQVDLKTAAQIIENGANNMGIFMNQVDRLAAAFSKLSPADISKLNQRITDLERSVARASANSDLH